MAAVAVALVLFGFYAPFVGVVVTFLWPVPILLIHLRHGLRASVLTLTVAGLVLVTFIGPLQALGIAVTLGASGLAFGECFRRRLRPAATLMAATGALFLAALVSLGISFFILGLNPIKMQLDMLREAMDMSTAIYSRLGLAPAEMEKAKGMWEASLEMLRFLFPAIVLMGAAVHAFINFQVARLVLGKLGYAIEGLPRFAEWTVPRNMLIGYVISLGLLMARPYYGWDALYNVALNLNLLFTMIYLVQGLAVGYFFLDRWKLPRLLSILILGYGTMAPLLSQALIWLGVFDSVFSFRTKGVLT